MRMVGWVEGTANSRRVKSLLQWRKLLQDLVLFLDHFIACLALSSIQTLLIPERERKESWLQRNLNVWNLWGLVTAWWGTVFFDFIDEPWFWFFEGKKIREQLVLVLWEKSDCWWSPAKLYKKKAPKKGREKETRGKNQSPGKQTRHRTAVFLDSSLFLLENGSYILETVLWLSENSSYQFKEPSW
jgi:hypothetical protein